MPFERLNESFYDHEITLPVGDRDFTIPSPDSDTGLFVQRVVVLGMQAAQNQPLTEDDQKFLSEAPDMTSDQLLDMILTPDIHAEVKAARLNWGAYQKIIGTCMQWVAFGREAAEAFWNAKEGESDPNPPAPQDHRSPSKQASGGQSRGTSTKKKAPAKKASGNPAKRAAGSAGSTSSGNGRSSRRTSSSSTASGSGTRTTTKRSPGTG